MKNLFTFVLFTLLLFSCQNEEVDSNKRIQNLNTDQKFKELTKRMITFNKNITIINNLEKIKTTTDKRKIISNNEAIEYIKTNNLNIEINKQLKLINYLIEEYDLQSYNQNELYEILVKEIQETQTNDLMNGVTYCKRKYRNDMIIITATAVAAHIACGTADLTIVLGGLCHGAAYAGQIAMSDNAGLEYRRCIGGIEND